MVKNYMEILVDEVYEEIKDSFQECECAEFENNIKSIALNNLQPAYFTSSVNDAKKKAFLLDKQTRINVVAKLAEARDILYKHYKKR